MADGPAAAPALPSGVSPAATASPAWNSLGPGCTTPRPTCEVTNTRSPQTIGDEMPSPRTGAFQAMFSVLLQRAGSPVSGETPVPDGPRQFGQLSAYTLEASKTISVPTHPSLYTDVPSDAKIYCRDTEPVPDDMMRSS